MELGNQVVCRGVVGVVCVQVVCGVGCDYTCHHHHFITDLPSPMLEQVMKERWSLGDWLWMDYGDGREREGKGPPAASHCERRLQLQNPAFRHSHAMPLPPACCCEKRRESN